MFVSTSNTFDVINKVNSFNFKLDFFSITEIVPVEFFKFEM